MGGEASVSYKIGAVAEEVSAYVNALRELYKNGRAEAWIFLPEGTNGREQRWPQGEFDAVREFIEWLADSPVGKTLGIKDAPELVVLDGYSCEGSLTHLLCVGGAYTTRPADVAAARLLSYGCMKSVFGENFGAVKCYVSHDSWASWFYEIGWDCTIFAHDMSNNRWLLICGTDTD